MKKFSRLIYVVIGIILTLCAIKVYYDASLQNNKMGFYVVEGSAIDETLKVTHPKDVYYIQDDKIDGSKIAKKFEYTVLADGTLSLNKYNGKNTIIVIPKEIDGKTVSIINFSGDFRKVVIPSTVKAITGNIEVTDKMSESQLTFIVVYAVALLIYITVILSATKKFDLKVSFLSLMYLLVPIIYTLCTKKYLDVKYTYDYTYLALMTATTIIYLIIVAIMVGYTKEKAEAKAVKKAASKKVATTTKKAAAPKKDVTPVKKAPAKKTTTKKTTTKKTTKKK